MITALCKCSENAEVKIEGCNNNGNGKNYYFGPLIVVSPYFVYCWPLTKKILFTFIKWNCPQDYEVAQCVLSFDHLFILIFKI